MAGGARGRAAARPALRTAARTASRRGAAPARAAAAAGEGLATTIVTSSASYVPVGLAHCFLKNEEGRLEDALRVEPINSSSLECMHVGAPTSFKAVTALTLGELHDLTIADLPEEFAGAELCEDFAARGQAAARTWTRTHAQEALMDIVPLGALKTDFNFCPEDRPRVVNAIRVVTDEDNIKQDKSIDVYDRFDADGNKKEEEEG